MIRHLTLFILLVTITGIASAQKIFEGQVLEKETETAVPGVTVKLIKENKGTQTNSRGYYKLTSTDTIATDTLQFTSIGYRPLKIAVSAFQQNMFIMLEADVTQLRAVTVTDEKKKIPPVHKFRMADIRTNSYNNPTEPFQAQHMFAVLIKAQKKNGRITSVKLGRRGFKEPNNPSGYAQFLLHVMGVDPATGKPGEKIYSKQVIVEDNSLMIDMDVSADNWVMDTDNYYIAIEWQQVPINERLVAGTEDIVWKTTAKGKQRLQDAPTYNMNYQPTLIAYIDSRKYKAYYADTPGDWHPYTLKVSAMVQDTMVPYDSHIALSATITY